MNTKTNQLSEHSHQKIIFFRVNSQQNKVSRLIDICHHHLERDEKILLLCADEKTEQFVDELLWKYPSSSFIPHARHSDFSIEKILITSLKKNLNEATYIFNLTTNTIFFEEPCRVIYEFDDTTNADKQTNSQNKFKKYKEKKYLIELR